LKKFVCWSAVAALALPAVAGAHGAPGVHGNSRGHGDQQTASQIQNHVTGHGQGHAFGHLKNRTYVLIGTVSDVSGSVVTVDVKHANHHGGGLVGQSVQFDLSSARVVGRVHDPSGVKVGDRVLVQARLPRDLSGTQQPYAARILVDRGPKPAPDTQSTQTDTGGDTQSDS
jgi:hypothetical protein